MYFSICIISRKLYKIGKIRIRVVKSVKGYKRVQFGINYNITSFAQFDNQWPDFYVFVSIEIGHV